MAKVGYNPSNSLRKGQSASALKGTAIRSYTRASEPSNKVSKIRGTARLDIPTPRGK